MCCTPDWTFLGGTTLKKTAGQENAQPENNNYSHGGGPKNRNSSPPSQSSPPSIPARRGGGSGGGMMEELSSRFGNLKSVSAAKNTPSANNQQFNRPSQLPKEDNTPAVKTTATNRFSPPQPPIVPNGKSNSAAALSDSDRLDAIEKKIDKIMAHLCIS